MIDFIPEQFAVKAQEPLIPTWLCKMVASMEGAIFNCQCDQMQYYEGSCEIIYPWPVYCEGPGTFISHMTVCYHVTVCVQMAAAMEAAILPVWPDAKLRRWLWNHLWIHLQSFENRAVI